LTHCFGYDRNIIDLPYIAEAAALMGDPARINILSVLKDDRVVSASSLAHVAGVAPSTASEHLAKLEVAGLIAAEKKGRYRYYRLASDDVAATLEALEHLAARTTHANRRPIPDEKKLRQARRCYDHLAGELAERITWTLVSRGHLKPKNGVFTLNKTDNSLIDSLGVDSDSLIGGERAFTRQCPDWSQNRPHLGGALGAALFEKFCEARWITPDRGSRVVTITKHGRKAINQAFEIDLPEQT
jgi:DNA-binding transcriptional ArsR family regulator